MLCPGALSTQISLNLLDAMVSKANLRQGKLILKRMTMRGGWSSIPAIALHKMASAFPELEDIAVTITRPVGHMYHEPVPHGAQGMRVAEMGVSMCVT